LGLGLDLDPNLDSNPKTKKKQIPNQDPNPKKQIPNPNPKPKEAQMK